MKYYANSNTWISEEDYIFQCKMAMFTKDCVVDAMWEHFGSRMTRKARYLVEKQYAWIERFVKNPNLLSGHMITYYGLKAEKELGMTPEDKAELQVIGARLFSELPVEQQQEATLLMMNKLKIA